MLLRVWRFLTLLLAALALTMTSAHVLELPVKMGYDTQLYTAVNGTLYRYFAMVGAVYTLGTIVTALVLVYLVRGRGAAFRWTLAGAICVALAFGSWLALVLPVNLQVADALRSGPDSVPAVWARLRPRWEYGHAAGFVLQLGGFCALAAGIISETETSGRRRALSAAS
jgi:hypothetical protein